MGFFQAFVYRFNLKSTGSPGQAGYIRKKNRWPVFLNTGEQVKGILPQSSG